MDRRIIRWMEVNCNGDWEHLYGINIVTTDRPGWSIKFDLEDTPLHNLTYSLNMTDSNYEYQLFTENKVLIGHGDLNSLNKIIHHFFEEIIPNHLDREFELEAMMPLKINNLDFWYPVFVNLLPNLKLKISRVPEFSYTLVKSESIDNLVSNDLSDFDKEIQVEMDKEYDYFIKTLYDGTYPVLLRVQD